MKSTISFALMLALVLSGCVTEQQQFDVDLYERLHADALALATKVDHGEMSRENATLQLVQMQFVTRNSAAISWKRWERSAGMRSGLVMGAILWLVFRRPTPG